MTLVHWTLTLKTDKRTKSLKIKFQAVHFVKPHFMVQNSTHSQWGLEFTLFPKKLGKAFFKISIKCYFSYWFAFRKHRCVPIPSYSYSKSVQIFFIAEIKVLFIFPFKTVQGPPYIFAPLLMFLKFSGSFLKISKTNHTSLKVLI